MISEKAVLNLVRSMSPLILRQSPSINAGGCALFAIELVKRLEAAGVTGLKIRAYGASAETNATEVEQNIFGKKLPKSTWEWNANGVYFDHVVVEWNGHILDATGVKSPDDKFNGWYRLQPGHISVKAMTILAKNRKNWNRWFNRRRMPGVRKVMDKCFENVSLAA